MVFINYIMQHLVVSKVELIEKLAYKRIWTEVFPRDSVSSLSTFM